MSDAATIAAIYRYPVKGLSAEPLMRVALAPGECLPHDRRFAVALAATRFDSERPEWLSKTHFIMLMRDEKLARLNTSFDERTGELTIEHAGVVAVQARLTEPEGCRVVSAFLADFLGQAVEGPLRVVEALGHAFADARKKPNATTDKYVSLINRASIGALETVVKAPVDPLRFRANIYLERAPAWTELDWIGSEIALGGARLRVIAAITRCAATQVNPMTAERDLDIVGALQHGFGRNLMGVYGEVVDGGDIAIGDGLTLAPAPIRRS
jgi:MOSC domain-containing protein